MHRIQKVILSDFFEHITKNYKSEDVITSATLELTTRCHFNCVHCYCKGLSEEDLPISKWKYIIDELYDSGCISVLITGGDPLIRKDFPEIYLYLKKKGFLVTVFTNGILIDEKIIKLFKEYPPVTVDISLYGSNDKTHDNLTQTKGMLKKVLDTLKKLEANDIKFTLKTMVLKENASDIKNIYNIAKKYNTDFRVDPVIDPRRNGDLSPIEHKVEPDIAAKAELFDTKKTEDLSRYFNELIASFTPPSNSKKLFHCMVEDFKGSLFVTAQGKISPCSGLAPWAIKWEANTKTNELMNIFWERFHKKNKLSKRRIDKCNKCRYIHVCSHCTARELAIKKDENKLEEYFNWHYNLNKEREVNFTKPNLRRNNEKEKVHKAHRK